MDAPATNHPYFVGRPFMRKTQPGAGWTKSPSPVLQGRSAESTTVQRAATYQLAQRLWSWLRDRRGCPHEWHGGSVKFSSAHRAHARRAPRAASAVNSACSSLLEWPAVHIARGLANFTNPTYAPARRGATQGSGTPHPNPLPKGEGTEASALSVSSPLPVGAALAHPCARDIRTSLCSRGRAHVISVGG